MTESAFADDSVFNPPDGRKGWSPRLYHAVIAAFLLRLPFLFFPEVIHRDSTEYVRIAREILRGNWAGGVAPPLYSFFITIVDYFVGDYEISGIIVSIISGTLLVVPVYYLAERLFNVETALVAAFLCAVHPTLYGFSGSVLTESIYYLLFAWAVLLGWRSFEAGRLIDVLLFGFATSLAYLVRPEAIGFLVVFCFWVAFFNPSGARRRWFRRGAIILLSVVVFLAASFPYLLALKKEFGTWQISRKASISIGSGPSMPAPRPTFGVKDGKAPVMAKRSVSLVEQLKNPGALVLRLGRGFAEALNKFQQALTPLPALFLVLCFAFRRREFPVGKADWYVVSYFLFFFGLVLPFFYITKRHASHLVPLALPWAGFGLCLAVKWLAGRAKGQVRRGRTRTLLYVLLMACLLAQGAFGYFGSRGHRLVQREVGLWMKDNLPRSARVMGWVPQETFYAELEWVWMSEQTYEKVLEKARSKGVEYLLLHEDTEEIPGQILETARKRLEVVLERRGEDGKIYLFRIPPAGEDKGERR